MSIHQQYRYIAVEGNIGSGKTSLSTVIAKQMNIHHVLERYKDNPFLPLFFKKPSAHALNNELAFMHDRNELINDIKSCISKDMQVVSDFAPFKSRLFAQCNLNESEWLLFEREYVKTKFNELKPDLLIYIHSDTGRLMQNIKKRGRDFESNINEEYLKKIEKAYHKEMEKINAYPVLYLQASQADFIGRKDTRDFILNLLSNNYDNKTHSFLLQNC